MADDDRLVSVMEKGFETLADLIRETNQRLDATNEHLDATNLRLEGTNHRLDATRRELGDEIRGTNARIDNLIEITGRESRGRFGSTPSSRRRPEGRGGLAVAVGARRVTSW
jgi:hypothetical protein